MAFEEWEAAILPKVIGTWNLHNVLEEQGHTPDFFLLFSSWSGLVGQYGQANYGAANTFLDAFVQYRHTQNLPASVVDIGLMGDIGYVSKHSKVMDKLKATASHVLHEEDLLDTLQLVIERSAPSSGWTTQSGRPYTSSFSSSSQVAIGLRSNLPITTPANRAVWKRDPRMALYRNMEAQSGASAQISNEALKNFLNDAAVDTSLLETDDGVLLLATEVGYTVLGFMMRSKDELDVNAPLISLGIDSLVSIELRNWFKQKLRLDMTVLEIMGAKTLLELGKLVADGLLKKYSGVDKLKEATTDTDRARKERFLEEKMP